MTTATIRTLPPAGHLVTSAPIAWAIALLAVLAAAVVPVLAGDEAMQVDPARRFLAPTWGLWLGTDHLGRDLFVAAALGLRTSLIISVAAVLISASFGWFVGAISAYVGGHVDNTVGRVIDLFDAFPGVILGIALVTVLGPSYLSLLLVLVLVSWVTYARVVRASVLTMRAREFVVASRMYGSSTIGTLWRHIRPNTADVVLAMAVVHLPQAMLTESVISFLGFGLQPPDISLGYIIASERDYLQTNPLPVVVTGLVLVVVCSSIATIGLEARRRTL